MSVKNKQRRNQTKPQTTSVPLVVLRTPSNLADVTEKNRQRSVASNAFDRLVEQVKATPLDWMNVHVRVMVGSLAMSEYFNHDSDVSNMFNSALVSLMACRTRYDVTDHWGLTIDEQDSIREIFHITDTLLSNVSLIEIKVLFGKAVQLYDAITTMNKKPMGHPVNQEAALKELSKKFKVTNKRNGP